MTSVIRAYLRKRKSGKYQARFYCADRNPKQKSFALGTSDATVARQKLAELERMIGREEWDPWADPLPEAGLFVSEAVERFLAAKSEKTRAATVRAYRGTLEAFAGAPADPSKKKEARVGFLPAAHCLSTSRSGSARRFTAGRI